MFVTKSSISKLQREALVVWMRYAILVEQLKFLSHKSEVLSPAPRV